MAFLHPLLHPIVSPTTAKAAKDPFFNLDFQTPNKYSYHKCINFFRRHSCLCAQRPKCRSFFFFFFFEWGGKFHKNWVFSPSFFFFLEWRRRSHTHWVSSASTFMLSSTSFMDVIWR